jgi:hypothetical protein
MNAKEKLNHDSTIILESDDDEHIVLDCIKVEETCKSKIPKKTKPKDLFNKIPVRTGKRFERPRVPNIIEDSVLTLHSDLYKYKPSQKEEVLLTVMDAHFNKMNEKEQVLPDLHKKWVELAADILTGALPHLPPFCEVNHKIPLIDETKRYNYHLPRCPDALKTQLIDKIQTYKDAGWWEETNVSQAAPMLCVYKKDGAKLCTVIDGRKRNGNTENDVTSFPNQEQMHINRYAWSHKMCGKLHLPQYMAHL